MDIRVLHCASEVAPYSKTGGLGDVAESLPQALRQLNCDVRVFTPFYRAVRDHDPALIEITDRVPIPIGNRTYHVHFWQTRASSKIPIYFLEKDEFYDRSFLYGHPNRGDYEDNPDRFIAFCRSLHALCVHLDWFPDVLHLHDWQTALGAAYQHFLWRYDPRLAKVKTIFTIHNLGYQGIFPSSVFRLTHLPPTAFSIHGLEFWGQCNFIKAGIHFADWLTTVSPRYSQEIQTPEFGFGLDQDLSSRKDRLVGILNGIDTNLWNPATDPYIPQNYDVDHLQGKSQCKRELLHELQLPIETIPRPLLAIIGRLVSQKGWDLIQSVFNELIRLPVVMVVLGTGDPDLERWIKEKEDHHPGKLRVILQFDENLAHCIEAGADIFLMPSRYEPCGLNQMYSLRYGTIPLVHATGGLHDSVIDIRRHPREGTGFKFYRYRTEDFFACLKEALDLFAQRDLWKDLQRRAMAQDFSWRRSAKKYLNLYEKVLAT